MSRRLSLRGLFGSVGVNAIVSARSAATTATSCPGRSEPISASSGAFISIILKMFLTDAARCVISSFIERNDDADSDQAVGRAAGEFHRAAAGAVLRSRDSLGEFPLMKAETAVEALGALAQEHRLTLFRLLVQAGKRGMPAGAIAEALGVPNSSLSFHLAQLRNAGLILQERQHRSLIYRANYGAMNALIDYLTENCCAGADCAPAAACEGPSRTRKSA